MGAFLGLGETRGAILSPKWRMELETKEMQFCDPATGTFFIQFSETAFELMLGQTTINLMW